MGNCLKISSKLDEINSKLDRLDEIEIIQDVLLKTIHEENQRLKKKTLELQMKIENYGMVFSGNPCRITPTNYEISKRAVHNTI